MTHEIYFSLPPAALAIKHLSPGKEIHRQNFESSNISIKDLENHPSVMIKVANIRMKAA